MVIASPPDAWFRSGPVASFLWSLDECCNPISERVPRHMRIAYVIYYHLSIYDHSLPISLSLFLYVYVYLYSVSDILF